MGKLDGKDIPDSSGGGTPKTLQPGNTVIKINGISLKTEPFPGDPVNVILQCEGEDMGETFQGFVYDKNKPELGSAKGQVGKVRGAPYNFIDGKTTGGVTKDKSKDMLIWLKQFCKATGLISWLDEQSHDTVEEFFEQIEKDKPFKDVWLNACLAGKTYINKEGFTNYDLFLPFFNAKQVPLEVIGATPSKLIKFSEEMHIKKSKKKADSEIESFGKGKSADLDI